MERSLSPAQPADVTTIHEEIQQLHTEMRVAASVPLVLPMPYTTMKVIIGLFTTKSPLHASGKRPHPEDDNLDAAR